MCLTRFCVCREQRAILTKNWRAYSMKPTRLWEPRLRRAQLMAHRFWRYRTCQTLSVSFSLGAGLLVGELERESVTYQPEPLNTIPEA